MKGIGVGISQTNEEGRFVYTTVRREAIVLKTKKTIRRKEEEAIKTKAVVKDMARVFSNVYARDGTQGLKVLSQIQVGRLRVHVGNGLVKDEI